MKRIWRHKWWVMAATLVIFLSIGAAAWAASSDDPGVCPAAGEGTADCVALAAAGTGGEGQAGSGSRLGAARSMLQGNRQRMHRLQAALLDELSEDMTPADKALYEQLMTTLDQQRAALEQARQDVRDTVEKLRELGKKYLGSNTETTG